VSERPDPRPGVVWVPVASDLVPHLMGRWIPCAAIRFDRREDGTVALTVSVVEPPGKGGA
jgi:hypothetical protein